jgi:hypothetical protein
MGHTIERSGDSRTCDQFPQPQAPPQQPPEPDAGDDPPDAFVPLPCAANTESWIVLFALAHFGQVIFVLPFITIFS